MRDYRWDGGMSRLERQQQWTAEYPSDAEVVVTSNHSPSPNYEVVVDHASFSCSHGLDDA